MDLNDVTVSNLLTLTSPSEKADNSEHIFVFSRSCGRGCLRQSNTPRNCSDAAPQDQTPLQRKSRRRCARASGKCLQAGGGSPVAQDFSGHDQEGWNEEALRLRLFNRTKFSF